MCVLLRTRLEVPKNILTSMFTVRAQFQKHLLGVCLKRQENCVLHYGGFSCIFNLKQCVGPAFIQSPPSLPTAASRIYKLQSKELLVACFYVILVLQEKVVTSTYLKVKKKEKERKKVKI